MITLVPFENADIPLFLSWFDGTDAAFLIQFGGQKLFYPLTENQIISLLADPASLCFKARDPVSGETVGHCQLMRIDTTKHTAAVGRVLIAPAHRGHGLGTALIRSLIDHAKNVVHLKELSLNVFEFNTAAYTCYRNIGFIETGWKEQYYDLIGQTWKAISMKLDLPHYQEG